MMRRRAIDVCTFIVACLALVRTCQAGMPGIVLSDLARMRLEVISFFLLGFLAAAAVTWWIWNSLAKDFSFLPRLTLAKSCALVALWGLLFVIVLTMISGARELMTPGAWEKHGATYRLKGDKSAAPSAALGAERQLAERKQRLQQLGIALTRFAAQHEGKYPAAASSLGAADGTWEIPQAGGERYAYLEGRSDGDGSLPLAYEPDCFDDDPLVLFADASVRSVPRRELERLLEESRQ